MKSIIRALAVLVLLPTLAGCAVPAAPVPEITLTPTASAEPVVTLTPSPEPSPTAPARYLGALSAEQRAVLNTAALAYVSETPGEARETAVRLGHISANGTAEMVCGPLSLAILQDAGLVDPSIPLVDFFYLNPRPGYEEFRVRQAFPEERFEKIVIEQSIDQIDYTQNPLYPGDFLYLFAGDSGSFEHMLVVSRVDEAGRAYSVTNIRTEEGIVIREVMLYDPNDPGTGQFYNWTNREYALLGRTGYGGLWLWRLKSP